MPCRSLAASCALLAVTSLAATSGAQAQARPVSRFQEDSEIRPGPAGFVIHCGPAPLTERPGVQREFSRPVIARLEAALAEAAQAKRYLVTVRTRSEP